MTYLLLFLSFISFATASPVVETSAGSTIQAFEISGSTSDLPYLASPPETCPPPIFSAKTDLNLTAYIANRWYVQYQMPTKYLPISNNFCVTAKYTIRESEKVSSASWLRSFLKWFRYSSDEIDINVYNYANRDEVCGEAQIGNLNAVLLNPNQTAELLVGPKFLPRLFWGPYWVVAAGPGPEYYSWAIVSGGPPNNQSGNGYCQTSSGVNNAGLWLFTAEQEASEARIAYLMAVAQGLGFDTRVLNYVNQTECIYQNIQNV